MAQREDIVVATLPAREGWDGWGGFRTEENPQNYLTTGGYGVMGSKRDGQEAWTVVYASDGVTVDDRTFETADEAMDAAEELAG